VDFNIHPDHKDWLRVLNVLLYLNKDWPAEYGGSLLIRTGPKDEPRAIAPLFNRCVMMLTSDNTYHRFRKMSLPPDRTRKSIAGYAYELIDEGSRKARTTSWAPEDGGGRKAGSCPALGQPGRRQEQADRQEGRVAGAPVMSSRLPILRTTFLGIRRVFLSETPTIGTG
jgi:hypothetical protein